MKNVIGGTIAVLVFAIGCGAEDASPHEHDSPTPEQAAQVSAPEAFPEGYVETPSGRFHESCVHEVPDGALVEKDGAISMSGKRLRAAPPPCAFAVLPHSRAAAVRKPSGDVASKSEAFEFDGWVASLDASATNHGVFPIRFNGLRSTMKVPGNPTVQLWQLIYIFPSLTPADGKAILQPVLQFGGEIGTKWMAAGWHVARNGNAFRSTRVNITPGELIRGSVTDLRNSCVGTDCTWQVRINRGNTQLAMLSVQSTEAYSEVQKGVFEAYDVTSCRQLPPAPAVFTDTQVFAPYDPENVDAKFDVTAGLTFRKNLRSVGANCGFVLVNQNPQTATILWSSN